MQKYIKPCVKKSKVETAPMSNKSALCSGLNSRKMPKGNFSKK